MQFKKAKREKLIGAIGMMGASGSGKTLGSLMVAYGMVDRAFPDLTEAEKWEKIAYVDTEHERSKVYVGMVFNGFRIGEFLHLDLQSPYTVDRYDEAARLAKEAGAYVVVFDSITHAWDGDGGLLDLQQSYGGTFQAWRQVNPAYKQFISIITGEKYKIHTISTMRLKQDYAVSTGDDGKLKVEKLGLRPVQRDSLEYELQVVFNIDMQHVARPSKDNSGMFAVTGQVLDPSVGHKLVDWLDKGVDVVAQERKELEDMVEYIRKVTGENGNPILTALLTDLEQKSNMEIEEMLVKKPNWLRRAFEIIHKKERELLSEEKELVRN